MKEMKARNYGLLSEVFTEDKILFVGDYQSCEKYISDHIICGENEFCDGVTRQVLKGYFDLVADRSNWKVPVSKAMVKDISEHEKTMIDIAVKFYTGSIPKWSIEEGFPWIEFDGYYKTIGA